jgi:hypothetical protein
MSGETGANASYDEDADYLAKLGLKQVSRLASEITVECGAEKTSRNLDGHFLCFRLSVLLLPF